MPSEHSERVFVLGGACTPFTFPSDKSPGYPTLGAAAVTEALKGAGIDYDQVETAVTSHCYAGTTAGQAVLTKVGMTGIPIFNTNNNCSSGSSALYLGRSLIASGLHDVVLVLGFEQMDRGLSEAFPHKPSPTQLQSNSMRKIGIPPEPLGKLNVLTSDVIKLFAEAANEYCRNYNTDPQIFAEIAVKNRVQGITTDYAMLRGRAPPSVGDVASKRMLSPPITSYMSAPTADGAAAVVLVSGRYLCNLAQQRAPATCPYVEFVASRIATDVPESLATARGMSGVDLATTAANACLNDALASTAGGGTGAPSIRDIRDIDVVELHDCFAPAEFLLYEALGMTAQGTAGQMWKSRERKMSAGGVEQTLLRGEKGGCWVVNPSGGLETKGHPIGATGVAQSVELFLHLSGSAGKRQVTTSRGALAQTALQHNFGFNGGAVVNIYRAVEPSQLSRVSSLAKQGSFVPSIGGFPTGATARQITNALVDGYPALPSQKRLEASEKETLNGEGYGDGWSTLTEDLHVSFDSSSGTLADDAPLESAGIRGSLPKDLVGTFLRNGPGISEVFGVPLAHPIDGDGVVIAVAFDGRGGVTLTSKFVETRTREAEQKAGKMLHRGQMGTQVPDNPKAKWRDVAHTNVFCWGDRLLALHEYALPYRICPQTLKTLGRETFGGALTRREDGSGGSLCAHFRYDTHSKRMILVSFSPMQAKPGAMRDPSVRFYEIDKDCNVVEEATFQVPGLNYVHDLSVTPSFYIVHMTPFVEVSVEGVMKILGGKSSPGEQMQDFPGAPCRIVVLRRPCAREIAPGHPDIMEFDLPAPVHIYHFSRAVEHAVEAKPGDDAAKVVVPSHHLRRGVSKSLTPERTKTDKVVPAVRCVALELEACVLARGFNMHATDKFFLSNAAEAPGVMARIVCRMGSTAATMVQVDRAACEFPVIHPQHHLGAVFHEPSTSQTSVLVDDMSSAPGVPSLASRMQCQAPARFSYLMANDRGTGVPFVDIVKMDAEGMTRSVWRTEGCAVGEPCFAPKPTAKYEDDGYVIVQVLRLSSKTTEFAVLDARCLEKGPIAVVAVGKQLPTGFHGTWTPTLCGLDHTPTSFKASSNSKL